MHIMIQIQMSRIARSNLAIAASAIFACTAANAQNDACSAATSIAGYGTFPFSTVGATTDGNADAGCLFFSVTQVFNDVWFCWTAPSSGMAEVSLCSGTTLDTKMAAYLGCGCPAPDSTIACNDDSCSLQSKLQFGTTAGNTYTIRVGSYASTGFGSGSFTVSAVTPLVDVTNPANGHRYIGLNVASWAAAEATAQMFGGHLASIADQAENDFVQLNFGSFGGTSQRLWIGFNDVASEGNFVWPDGSPGGYTNWNAGEPNNAGSGEDATEMLGTQGTWNDMPDSGGTYLHMAVIEIEGGTPPPPPCLGDVNRDGIVSGADLGLLLGDWGQAIAQSDLDSDGIVTGADLGILLGRWGPCN
jgi:hypothetical protein